MLIKVQPLASLSDILPEAIESLLTEAINRRWLNSLAVGVLHQGKAYARLFGDGITQHSQFQIASLTKVYTAELLARMVAADVVRLDTPVGSLLQPNSAPLAGDRVPITLLDLATHHSGLPRIPTGLALHSRDPYARYTRKNLDTYLRKHPLSRRRETKYSYSNFGYTLLGEALAEAAGIPFPQLLKEQVLDPAGLANTRLTLVGHSHDDLLQGHTQAGIPTPAWNFDTCAPCGALQSSLDDQLQWLNWLREDPDRLAMKRHAEYTVRALTKTATGGIGLAWHLQEEDHVAWHNGATFGFSSYMSLDKRTGSGIVLLSNRCSPALITTLGRKLDAALQGKPIKPFSGNYGLTLAGIVDPLQFVLRPALAPMNYLPRWLHVPAILAIFYTIGYLFDLLASVFHHW